MAEVKTAECVICLNDFKKKQIVQCGFCEYIGCVGCSRRYVLNQTNDPCCPNCNHPWDLNFTRKHLGKSFMNKEYKTHKKQLLFDIEVSKIPQTMELVERETKKEEINQDINLMQEEIEDLEQQIRELGRKIYNKKTDLNKLKTKAVQKKEFKLKCPFPDCGGFINNSYVCAVCKNKTCKDCYEIMEREKTLNEAKREVWTYTHTCNPASVESFKLIKKETRGCPNCATRISKISGCDQMWCTECHVAFSWTTGRTVTGTIHNPHFYEWQKQSTDLDNLRNPGEILCGGLPRITILHNILDNLKNTLKYGVTGKIVPYQGGCGQNYAKFGYLPIGKKYNTNEKQNYNFGYSYEHKEYRLQIEFIELMILLHRKISHFQNEEVQRLRNKVRDIHDMDDYDRCRYIRKETSEDNFKRNIMKKHKKKQKLIKILHIYEMGYVTIIETYNEIFRITQTIYQECAEHRKIMYDLTYQCQRESKTAYYNNVYKPWEDNVRTVENKKITDLFDRFYKIVNYCNRELYKVSELYSQVVPFIGISIKKNDTNMKNLAWNPQNYPNYNLLTSIELKYDNKIFQLYKTVVTEKSAKNVKIKDETQTEHLNNNPLFNFNNLYVYKSRYNEAYRNGQSDKRYIHTFTSLNDILNNKSCFVTTSN